MTVRSYSSVSGSASLPPSEIVRPMKVAADYGSRSMSSLARVRAASVPPLTTTTLRLTRQQTPAPQQRPAPRRLSTTPSVYRASSSVLSSFQRSPVSPGQFSRHSVSSLPVARSRSLALDTDDEPVGSLYSTKSLSYSDTPLRPSYKTGKTRPRHNYLDDIEEEDKVSRQQMSDLRMRMSKAKECFDRHRQVLDRLRAIQLNGPAAPVSPSSTSPHQPVDTSSVRQASASAYLPVSMPAPRVTVSATERIVTPARRMLRELLSRSRSSRKSYG